MMKRSLMLNPCLGSRIGRMPMRQIQLRSFALTLVLTGLLVGSFAAKAQDTAPEAVGINPQATYSVGAFDAVSLVTGRLSMHIPLFTDHSQRGKLNFTYSLEYSSTGNWHLPCFNNNECQWTPGKYGIGGVGLANLSVPAGALLHFHDKGPPVEDYYEHTVSEGGAGRVHDLALPATGPSAGFPVNGSGYSVNSGIKFSGVGCLLTQSATDSNGNEITTSYVLNGNSIICTTTDTLGRIWTLTTNTSTNLSACPVSATNTTTWVVPGPAGGTRQFTFCYSTVSVQPTFQPPTGYRGYSATPSLMTGVILPDGSKWKFTYDTYGEITQVSLPTGVTCPHFPHAS